MRAVSSLRKSLPSTPIVAVVSEKQFQRPGSLIDQSVDAIVKRNDTAQPTVHDVLLQARQARENYLSESRTCNRRLALPWRNSQYVGALLCDVNGRVIDANRTLMLQLGYTEDDSMIGASVPRDLLNYSVPWDLWKTAAGAPDAIFRDELAVVARNRQIHLMEVELFASREFLSLLQIIFVDRTENTLLASHPQSTVK
jgi:PAS domain-containing protein